MENKQFFSHLRFVAVASMMLLASSSFAQSNQVRGTVKDSSGEPAIGANIRVKGTNTVAVADVNGNYTIKCEPGQTLEVSYIGFGKQEIKVGNRKNVNVELKENDTDLDEVVVIGYGTVRKVDLAGSVATMDRKSFKDQPITDISETLQGRMAGVYVENSGVPGGTIKIRVRGANSVNKSNDPLYVVDGVVRESGLEGINPDDIKSIQVLKDASSTAIYGARGANGVVLIETKGGVAGKTEITFNANVGVSTMPKTLNTLNAQEYANVLVQQGKDKNALSSYLDGSDEGIDWQDQLFRTGINQNYRVGVASGNEQTQYRISGDYTDRKGIIEGTDFKRYQGKIDVTSKLTKWLTVRADLGYTHLDIKGNGMGMSGSNPIFVGLNYAPTMSMMDEDGNYNRDPYGSIQENPYGMLKANQNDRNGNIVNGLFELKFNIVKGLTFTTTNGVDYKDFKSYNFSSTRVNTTNRMINSDRARMMLQTSNNLTYQGNWGEHHLTATGVWEASSNETRYMKLDGSNLMTESVGYWNYNIASDRTGENSYSKWTMLSGVARLMYNYGDRYMITGTMRADGSSRFSKDKWGYFPSVAAAWTLSNEKFMKDIDCLDMLKLRASYGIVGNQAIDPYSTLGMLTSTSYNYGTSTNYTGYYPTTLATPDLTWEKTKQFNVGFDLSLWRNRLNITADYFIKRTTDALLKYTAADYVGATEFWVNSGEVSNKGVDIAISSDLIRKKNVTWNTAFTGTYLKNRVEDLAGLDYIYGDAPASGLCDVATIVKEGYALGSFYGYRWAGINDQGQDTYYTKDGGTTTAPSSEDREVLGHASPNFTLGWNNHITIKNWDINVFFNSAFGGKRLNLLRYAMASMPGSAQTITLKEAVEQAGTNYPAIGVKDNTYESVSSKWVENANYLRLDNLSVAYTFKAEKNHVADIRLGVSAQNLFTITKYKGYDPTSFAAPEGHADVNAGVDIGAYPNPRSFTVSVGMNFPIKQKNLRNYEPEVVERIVEKIVEKPVTKEVVKEVVKEVPATAGTAVVTFGQGSAEISDAAELDAIKAGQNVEVVAYSSPEGNADANQELSQKRADAVAKYLTDKGVNVKRVTAKGADSAHANRIAVVTVVK